MMLCRIPFRSFATIMSANMGMHICNVSNQLPGVAFGTSPLVAPFYLLLIFLVVLEFPLNAK